MAAIVTISKTNREMSFSWLTLLKAFHNLILISLKNGLKKQYLYSLSLICFYDLLFLLKSTKFSNIIPHLVTSLWLSKETL